MYANQPWWSEWARPAGPDPGLRVSDAERTEVTDALCRHFADGRLDQAELDERLARATAARTRADLAPLLADLPRLDPPLPVSRRHDVPPIAWVVAGALLLGALVATAATHVPWVLFALVAFVVLRHRGRHHDHHHHRRSDWSHDHF